MSEDIDWTGLSNRQYAARYGKSTRIRKAAVRGSPTAIARMKAHEIFDLIWKRRIMTRSDAYAWLAVQMGWPEADCHMGMMNEIECMKVRKLAEARLAEARQAALAARNTSAKSADTAQPRRKNPVFPTADKLPTTSPVHAGRAAE